MDQQGRVCNTIYYIRRVHWRRQWSTVILSACVGGDGGGGGSPTGEECGGEVFFAENPGRQKRQNGLCQNQQVTVRPSARRARVCARESL